MTAKILSIKYVDRIFQFGLSWQSAPAAIMVLLVASLLAACGGGGSAAPASWRSESTPAATSAAQTISSGDKSDLDLPEIEAHDNVNKPCEDGVLTVAEVATLDNWWKSSFDSLESDAENWQSDAQLVSANIICWFGDELKVSTTYKSETANEARDFPEGENLGGMILDPMDASLVSFTKLHDSLIAAGFTDETIITGIEMSDIYAPYDAEIGMFGYHVGEYNPDGVGKNVTINPKDGSFEFLEL